MVLKLGRKEIKFKQYRISSLLHNLPFFATAKEFCVLSSFLFPLYIKLILIDLLSLSLR